MSNVHEIKIKKGYSDGTLKLSPKQTFARNKDFISWIIDSDTVTSIEKIEKKSGADIFIIPPHANGRDWSAEIKDNLPADSECEYLIGWNGKYGPKVFDPKISVNPTDSFMKVFIGLAVAFFLAILSFGLLQQKRNGK